MQILPFKCSTCVLYYTIITISNLPRTNCKKGQRSLYQPFKELSKLRSHHCQHFWSDTHLLMESWEIDLNRILKLSCLMIYRIRIKVSHRNYFFGSHLVQQFRKSCTSKQSWNVSLILKEVWKVMQSNSKVKRQ